MLKRLRNFIKQLKQERRQLGWRGVFRKRGWKLVLGFLVFYLVRDLIIYILIPFAVYTGLTRTPPVEESSQRESIFAEER